MKFGLGLIVFLFLHFSHSLYAQNIEKLEKKAQRLFYQEDFPGAIELYNEILSISSKHKLAKYRLTICSLMHDYRNHSVEEILIYKKTQGRKDKFFNYWLGRIYFEQSNFKKAIETWDKFLNSDKYYSSMIISETKEFMALAERAHEQYSHPRNYEIEQLSEVINSPFTELSPVYFREEQELLFLSDKSSYVPGEDFEIYHSFIDEGEWAEPTKISGLGKFLASNANIEVVNEGGRLYLYHNHGHKKGQLYFSEKSELHKWREIQKVEGDLSAAKLESHFFINEKEDRLLFAHRSGKPPYDLDIFESSKDPSTGKWRKPTYFSDVINSEFDEDYPYMTPDGQTLYFSSKGYESLGSYDIYKSKWDPNAGQWGQPESLLYPTNSTDDDIQFKIDHETNSGYFVSDRFETYGSYDIFFFHESEKVLLSGTVKDGSGKPADFAQIQFFPKRKTGLIVKAMTDKNGEYKVRVGNDDEMRVDIYFHDEIAFTSTFETAHSEGLMVSMTKDFVIAENKPEAEVEISEHIEKEFTTVDDIGNKFRESKKAQLSNIYFEFSSYELTTDNYEKLDDLLNELKEYQDLELMIAGHTDNVGTDEFNMTLSKKRAESLVDYLVSKGISSYRLQSKGYGHRKPIASNDDEKEGRELNRRIEVVVIE